MLPNDNAQLPPPSYVGFGRRARSLMNEEGRYTFDQLMPVTEDFGVVGERHVKVFRRPRHAQQLRHRPASTLRPRESPSSTRRATSTAPTQHSDAPVDEKHRKRRLALLGVLKILWACCWGCRFCPRPARSPSAWRSMPRHTPECGFEDEPTEQAPPSEAQAMIIAPEETLGELALPPEQAWQTAGADLVDGQIGGRRRSGRPKAIAAHGA